MTKTNYELAQEDVTNLIKQQISDQVMLKNLLEKQGASESMKRCLLLAFLNRSYLYTCIRAFEYGYKFEEL